MGSEKRSGVFLLGLALLSVMCGRAGGLGRDDGGGGASDAGFGSVLPDDDEIVAGTGGGTGGGTDGGTGGGDMGPPGGEGSRPRTCSAGDQQLSGVYDHRAGLVYELRYDAQGRLRLVDFGDFDDYQYDYSNQDGSLSSVLHGFNEGMGFLLGYPSPGVITFTDDDYPQYYQITYENGWWTAWASIPEVGSNRYDKQPVWEQGLLTQITHLRRKFMTGQEPVETTSVETFSYDYDTAGNPIRMLSSMAAAPWRTREVYDELGNHLFQLVESAQGAPGEIRFFRDNQDPVYSLFEPANPGTELASGPNDFASNEWLRLPFNPELASEPLQGLAPHGYVRPLDLAPWHPLAFTPEETSDFASDIDGDQTIDVRGDFTFDDQDRFTGFVLELEGVERVVLEVTYTPRLITETASYPGSDRPDDVREYFYGCDGGDFPEGLPVGGAPAN